MDSIIILLRPEAAVVTLENPDAGFDNEASAPVFSQGP